MKKKIYLICYAVVQIITSIYLVACSKSVATAQIEMLEEMFKVYPAEMQEMMNEIFNVEYLASSVIITGIIGIILGAVLLWLFAKNKVASKKGLTLSLTIASIVVGLHDIAVIMAIVALILVIKTDKSTSDVATVKEKKEIQKLRPLKVTSKDLLWVVILVLAYSTQFFIPNLIDSSTLAIIYDVVFNVLVFLLVLYIFNKRLKRDFGAFKENFRRYIGYIFKWWGIMLGLSLIAGILRMVLGGAIETANQGALNSLPLWYVGPLAIIWAPVVEEAIFRGGLSRFVKHDKLFIVLSAVLFGLLHTLGTETGIYNILIQSLQYMVMGGVMAYTYTKTNNIFVNMGIHCVQNTVGVILMALMSFM